MLAFDGGRYVVAVALALAVFFGVWRSRFAHRRLGRRPWTRRQIARELAWSASTASIFASMGVVVFYGRRAGLMHVYRGWNERGAAWFVLTLVALPVLHDAYFYWTHRAMHHRFLFRVVHRVHHLSNDPSPFAAYAFSPLEALVHALFVPLTVAWLPVSDLALFLFLAFMILRNVYGHLGIEPFPSWFVRSPWTRWSTTTTHHAMHHARFSSNYGLYFTFWDRLMGTTHASYETAFEDVAARARTPSLHVE